MAIDPIDTARDDANRVDRKRTEARQDAARPKSAEAGFLTQYQARLKTKEKELEKKSTASDDKTKQKDGDFLSKIIEAFRGKEEGREQDKSESKKKDQERKDKFQEGPKTESRGEDGHARTARLSSDQQGSDRGGGGGSKSDGEGGGSQSGGKGGSFQSSTGSGGRGSSYGGGKGVGQGAPAFVKKIGASAFEENKNRDTRGGFSEKTMDEIVESVRIGLNEKGDTEMEVKLGDDYFSGLKLKAIRTLHGVVLVFVCPTREVKNIFLAQRPKIYARLKEKNIQIIRIDIV